MEWNLKVLGSSSALPTDNRLLSSQLLSTSHHHFLFDCGEGTQFQLRRFGAPISKIDTIFISHLHGDHVFGIFGLLSTYYMYKREKSLKIYGPKGIKKLIDGVLKDENKRIVYHLEILEIAPQSFESIFDSDEVKVYAVPLHHSVISYGFYVVEKPGKLNIRKEFVKKYSIPIPWYSRIQNGEDYIDSDGKVFKNKEITLPPAKNKSFAYISDTAFVPDIATSIHGVNLLYHEATFSNEHKADAVTKLHSTAEEAALMAKSAHADKLLIGHFSTRYKEVEILLKEAQQVFPNTLAAFDGMDIKF